MGGPQSTIIYPGDANVYHVYTAPDASLGRSLQRESTADANSSFLHVTDQVTDEMQSPSSMTAISTTSATSCIYASQPTEVAAGHDDPHNATDDDSHAPYGNDDHASDSQPTSNGGVDESRAV